MHVLVSTQETQGQRKNDFCFVPEGELVMFAFECDGEAVDGSCGCRRSMGGVDTHTATTTMKVVEKSITPAILAALYFESLRAGGWGQVYNEADLSRLAGDYASEMCRIAANFIPGAIIEKRGRKFQMRPAAKR